MKININKDLTKFKKEKFNGNSTEENLKLVITAVVILLISIFLYMILHIPLFLSVILVTPIGLIISLFNFMRFGNLTFAEWIKVTINYYKNEPLLHKAMGYEAFVELFKEEYHLIAEKEELDDE